MKNNVRWAIILIIIFFFLSQSPSPKDITITTSDESEFANLVDADLAFNGVDKHVSGTSVTSEFVRVMRLNGGRLDLGAKTLNSGTLSVTPEVDYRLYFFLNATVPSDTYYVDVQDYTAKVQDSVDNLVGQGCSIDTNPIVIVRNSNGQVQTATANAEVVGASATTEVEVEIGAHMDKCYGTPKSPKGNAVCFAYDGTAITNVKSSSTDWISVPNPIVELDQGTIKCYEFDLLENGARDILTVQLTSDTDPTVANNISIFTDDIGFDLNQNNLEEIWDFSDENRNQLARTVSTTPDAYIYIS